MKISLSSFTKMTALILSVFGIAFSGILALCWGILPFFTHEGYYLHGFLMSVCALPVFGFIFMRIEEGISVGEFVGRFIFLPIAGVLFLALIVAVCVFAFTTISEASATNVLLFFIALFLAIIALKRKGE